MLGTVGVFPRFGLGPIGTQVGGSCSGAGLDDGCSMGLQGCSIDTIKGMSVGSRGGLLVHALKKLFSFQPQNFSFLRHIEPEAKAHSNI